MDMILKAKLAKPPGQAVDTGRLYGGETAIERAARQRRQFMDAGLELFGTIGYRATCRQAGLIDRYFYRNFRDTEDLLAAIYNRSLDDMEALVVKAVSATLPSSDHERVTRVGLDAFFEAFENSRVARVCWLEARGISPRIDALYADRTQKFARLLLTFHRALFPGQAQDPEEANIVAIALVGAISQSAAHWLLSGYRAERRVLVAANALILRGLAKALQD
jgi:AcrR family transcriptional regulator